MKDHLSPRNDRRLRQLCLLPIIVALLTSAGCATMSAPSNAAWLPQEARSAPQRHVVVTVHNDTGATPSGVGSTPRGYNTEASYSAGRKARAAALALAGQYHLQAVASWPISVLNVYCLVYRIPGEADRNVLLAALQRDPRVESAQPLENFSTQSTPDEDTLSYNDTYAGLQRNLDALAIPQAQRRSRGQGVRIAVIDTGVAIGHADLRGRIAGWRNFVDGDTARFVRDRHGTAVAGVIAAVANNNIGIVGIAPEAQVFAFKACWEIAAERSADCNTFTLAQALSAAIDARVDIVNLSLAGPSDPLLTRLVRSGQHAGIIFVGAAAQTPAGFPIDITDVIGVEASESSAPDSDLIAAPGKDIFTLTPDDHYDAVSGSSLASAEVTAMVALLRARDSRLAATQARQLLKNSSRPIGTAAGNRDTIDACEALSALLEDKSCLTTHPSARQASAPLSH